MQAFFTEIKKEGTASSIGFIVSNIASKFRKFRGHSLSAKTGFIVLFLFTI